MRRIVLFLSGFLILIAGMALTLRYFEATAIIVQGALPPVIAVVGLILMFVAGIKR